MKNKEGDSAERIALLDMDGTVVDYDGEMQRQMRLLMGPDEKEFTGWDDVPPHIDRRRDLIRRQPGFWRNLPRLEAGFEVLDMILKIGFETHVLTKGPKRTTTAWTEKVEWCDANLPPEVEVTVTRKKSLVYGRVLVDDFPPYFMPWLEQRPRGLVIAVRQDWNKDAIHPNVIVYDGSNKEQVFKALQRAYSRLPSQPF